MGATNFRPHNASKCFVVLENEERKYWECPDCNERHYDYEYDERPEKCGGCGTSGENMEEKVEIYIPDEDDLQSVLDYLNECFGSVDRDSTNELQYVQRKSWDRTKVGGDKVWGELYTEKRFGETNYNISLNITLQYGYYEAAILDYSFDWEGCGYPYNNKSYVDENEVLEVIDDYTDNISEHYANTGMGYLQQENFERWVNGAVEQLVEAAEAVFEKVAPTKAVILGTGSNGVAFYQKVD